MSAIVAMTIEEALREEAAERKNRDSQAVTELRGLIAMCLNRMHAGVPQDEAVGELIGRIVTFVSGLGDEEDFAELIAEAEEAARRAEDAAADAEHAAADAESAAARLAKVKSKGAKR
ncbi:hypothetical protein [Microcystis phage Mae-JY09]